MPEKPFLPPPGSFTDEGQSGVTSLAAGRSVWFKLIVLGRREKSMRKISLLGAWLALILACGSSILRSRAPAALPPEPLDLLLQGGHVVDGSGSAPHSEDVGLRGDRIVFLGNASKEKVTAKRTLDVHGLIVCPGFIDPHTHTGGDLSSPTTNGNVNYLMQGVTTVVTGNDGGGSPHVAKTLDLWQRQGIGTNALLLVGHGAVRREVLGNGDVQPTPEQLESMKALVRSAMQEGAFGMSTGLFYVPGSFAKTEEVIELAKVAAAMGGYYDSHMRDEDSYSIGLLGSIAETIRIGREAKIPVHISHIKALGPEVWGKSVDAIRMIEKAQADGVNVTADQYPYTASGSSLVASLLPSWAQAGNSEEVLARLDDPALRTRLLQETTENLQRRGGAGSLLFTSSDAPELLGKRLSDVAKEKNLPPVEAALAVMRERKLEGLAVASFNMNEDDVIRFMKRPWVMTGSDGSHGHPRMFGTFPRKLRVYVYQKKLITLPFMVHASSDFPARTIGIPERGLLRIGYFADVIAFDPATVSDKSTYEHPNELAVGMKYVIVNGKLAVEDGKYTGVLAGRPLRKQLPASSTAAP
ncbi:MAG TPA: D-aminoacylase [Candidatus Methylomirabilis sp.]|nr:D-aminoacylase [Candidatus Methylomirabilis sp.]